MDKHKFRASENPRITSCSQCGRVESHEIHEIKRSEKIKVTIEALDGLTVFKGECAFSTMIEEWTEVHIVDRLKPNLRAVITRQVIEN